MANPFTKHPKHCVDETWWEHCKFAICVGFRLIMIAFIFMMHGIFPFIVIPRWLNLEESINFLMQENKNREKKKL